MDVAVSDDLEVAIGVCVGLTPFEVKNTTGRKDNRHPLHPVSGAAVLERGSTCRIRCDDTASKGSVVRGKRGVERPSAR